MRSKLLSLLTVIGAVTVLVLAANSVALAATGKSLLLGKSNSAAKVTTVKRTTAGPALALKTKKSTDAPLTVNGTGKVVGLNADSLDGLDSTALRANTYVWTKTITSATNFFSVVVPLPAGTYDIGYATTMIGGGTNGGSARCYFFKDPAVGANSFYGWTSTPTLSTEDPALSGSGVVALAAGDSLHFYCTAPTTFTAPASQPIQVFATKAAVAGGGTL